eukprot:Rmarinus@m.4047
MATANEESFHHVLFGTFFESDSDEEKSVRRKEKEGQFVPVWQQEVRDERGLRRFHGAFTGGFSAGYFNSVGTKEGWAPSSFVSSRSSRAEKAKSQSVEDFLDDEDRLAMGRQKALVAHEKYEDAQKRPSDDRKIDRIAGLDTGGSIPGLMSKLVQDMEVQPSDESIGNQLLKKMGWKEGKAAALASATRMARFRKRQGRVRQSTVATVAGGVAESRAVEGKKVFGCQLPPSLAVVRAAAAAAERVASETQIHAHGQVSEPAPADEASSEESGNESDMDILGEAEISAMFRSKTNRFGIGFDAHRDAPEFKQAALEKPAQKSTVEAFGVGAFEEDDEDVYGGDTIRSTMFAFDERHAEPSPQKKPTPHSYVPSETRSGRVSHDGVAPPRGFVLSEPCPPPRQWELPQVPRDYTPRHRITQAAPSSAVVPAGPTGASSASTETPRSQGNLTAAERQAILGEKSLPSSDGPRADTAKQSVFDFIPEEERRRLQELRSRFTSAGTTSRPEPSVHVGEQPATSASEAAHDSAEDRHARIQAALVSASAAAGIRQGSKPTDTFVPFADNPPKRQRYLSFLEATKRKESVAAVFHGLPLDERAREMDEFTKVSKFYKPLSAPIASRFSSGGMLTPGDPAKDAKPTPEQERRDDAHDAARMKMYGRLTRTVEEWFPSPLLCKRLGVVDPHKGKTHMTSRGREVVESASDKFFHALQANLNPAAAATATATEEGAMGAIEPPPAKTTAEEEQHTGSGGHADEDESEAEGAPPERPSMDMFKAIFENDDESDEEEEEAAVRPPPHLEQPSGSAPDGRKHGEHEDHADGGGGTTVSEEPDRGSKRTWSDRQGKGAEPENDDEWAAARKRDRPSTRWGAKTAEDKADDAARTDRTVAQGVRGGYTDFGFNIHNSLHLPVWITSSSEAGPPTGRPQGHSQPLPHAQVAAAATHPTAREAATAPLKALLQRLREDDFGSSSSSDSSLSTSSGARKRSRKKKRKHKERGKEKGKEKKRKSKEKEKEKEKKRKRDKKRKKDK